MSSLLERTVVNVDLSLPEKAVLWRERDDEQRPPADHVQDRYTEK